MNKFTEAYAKARNVLENQVFESKWQEFLFADCQIKALFAADGLAVVRAGDPDKVRKRLRDLCKAKNRSIGAVIVEAAQNPVSTGTLAERAATLKMLRHLYHVVKKGGQNVWVYSPPKAYRKWIFDELTGDAKALEPKLNHETKIFSRTEMRWMAAALAVALKIAEDTKAKLSGAVGKKGDTDAVIRRWFLGKL